MSLIIDPELRRQFKTAAALQGTEMTTVLTQFIEDYVKEHLPGGLPAKKKGGRK